MAQLRANALASSTKETYRTQLKSYLSFCELLCFPPLPVSNQVLLRYVAYLSTRLSYSSIRQYLAVLRYISLEAGLPNPLCDDWLLTTLLKGLKREIGNQVTKKSPVTPELLLRLRKAFSPSCSLDRAVWVSCLLMFFALLRKSNVFPPSVSGFIPHKHLSRSDFSLADPSGPPGLNLTIRWSKTLQFADRELVVPVPCLAPHPLCPVSALAAAFGEDPLPFCSGPAFWYLKGDTWVPLRYTIFLDRFKLALNQAGLNAHACAVHSFRRGGATRAFAMGVPGELIRVMGDWRSDAYLGYLDFSLQSRISAMATFCSDLPSSY